MNNPFELLTDDKDKAEVMRIEAYFAMLLSKSINQVGREKAAEILGVSKSRLSRLANRTGSGMSISLMMHSLLKLGAVVVATPESKSDSIDGFTIKVEVY